LYPYDRDLNKVQQNAIITWTRFSWPIENTTSYAIEFELASPYAADISQGLAKLIFTRCLWSPKPRSTSSGTTILRLGVASGGRYGRGSGCWSIVGGVKKKKEEKKKIRKKEKITRNKILN